MVDGVEGHAVAGRSDNAHCVVGHENVGVGRLAAAVDDHVVDSMAEDKERTFGGKHIDRNVGHASQEVSPNAGGVDGYPSPCLGSGAAAVIAQLHAHDAATLHDEARYLVIGQDVGPVAAGVNDVSHGKPERVDGGVGNFHRPDERWVDRRLHASGLLGRNDVGTDTGLAAGGYESGLIGQVVLGQGDEESIGLIDAMAGYAPQNHVLLDTFPGRLRVGHGISGATMEQSMVASRGAVGKVILLYEQHFQTAHGAVAGRSGTGYAASDDDDVIFFLAVCVHLDET